MSKDIEHVMDVVDAYDEDVRHSVYRCGECFALIQGFDVQDHISWHRRQETKHIIGPGLTGRF